MYLSVGAKGAYTAMHLSVGAKGGLHSYAPISRGKGAYTAMHLSVGAKGPTQLCTYQ